MLLYNGVHAPQRLDKMMFGEDDTGTRAAGWER